MNTGSVLILNYHRIAEKPYGKDIYTVSPAVLFEHLALIRELNIPVVSLDETGKHPYDFAVALTFDDGYDSDLNVVVPLLEQFNFPAAFFPIVRFMEQPGRLTWQQLQELAAKNFTIGSHGLTHKLLTRVHAQSLQDELVKSKKVIETHTGKTVHHFSVPYGRCNKLLVRSARTYGYQAVFITGLKVMHNRENFVQHRWNITHDVTLERLKKILCANGNLPFITRCKQHLKDLVRNAAGSGLVTRFLFSYE